MENPREPSFDVVEQALCDAGSAAAAAEIHGDLCGRMCALGEVASSAWIEAVMADAKPTTPVPESVNVFEALAMQTASALEQGDMSFSLLLPPDDASLEIRAENLGLWCQGFLSGLGPAAEQTRSKAMFENGLTGEIIQDFSKIARAGFGGDETETEGEAAYMELVEYVRVSVQLVFEEWHRLRGGPSAPAVH